MNYRLKRFIEKTMPNVIFYGAVVLITTKINIWLGLLAIFIFAGVDVIMIRKPKRKKK